MPVPVPPAVAPRRLRALALTLLAPVLVAPFLVAGPAAADHGGPPLTGKLDMTGEIGNFDPEAGIDDPVHDPTLFEDKGTYYVFSTGRFDPSPGITDPGGVFVHRSTESLAGPWESVGEIAFPEWARDFRDPIGPEPGVESEPARHIWAPFVVERAGVFYLYYSVSSFANNYSAIGLATSRTPGDLDSWVDQGPILTSPGRAGDGDADPTNDVNAIDPMVFRGDRGRWYITFGSFWSGIKIQELVDMRTPVGPVIPLATRAPDVQFNPIENPQIFRHGRYWYLTTSWDFCCSGANSTYKTAVGRSTSPTGPYVDREGVPLMEGGGTVILEARGNQLGTGALDVLREHGRLYAVHHYYDADDPQFDARMQIREVEWEDGWPVFPLYEGDA